MLKAPYRTSRVRTTRGLAACAAVASLATLSGVTRQAEASGFLFTKFGGDDGQPAIGSAHSVFYNPAAIGDAPGTQLVLDGNLVYRFAKYQRPASALNPGAAAKYSKDPSLYAKYVDANTGTATSSGVQGAPYFGATTDFGGKLPIFAGIASYIPEGGMAQFGHVDRFKNDPQATGAYDGVQRWALVSGKQISWWNTLAVGTTIKPLRLSIAVSASLVRDTLQSLIARNQDPSDYLGTPTGVPTEGRSLLDVAGTHLALGAGLFWRSADNALRLGASWMSGQGLGESRLKGTLDTQFGLASPQKQDADMLQKFPDVFRFGLAYRALPTLDLRADAEWVRWSVFEHQCIVQAGAACNIAPDGSELVPPGGTTKVLLNLDRRWQDAVGFKLGAAWIPNEDTQVTASFGFDTSAVPDKQLDATYFDAFKLLFSLGVRQRLGGRYFVGATLTQMTYLEVDNSATAVISKNAIPSRSGSNGGIYTSSITFLDVSVGMRL
jgi:long-chain fatty acid transport protein